MSFQTQFHVSFRTEFSKKFLPNIMRAPHNAMFPSNYREDKNIESAIPFPAPEKGDNRGLSPFHSRKIIVFWGRQISQNLV